MESRARPDFADFAARFSLGWLVAGCLVGVVCAGGLVLPALGLPALAGYGRLMTVHMDVQLYGWSFLPLLALIAFRFFPEDEPESRRRVLILWSAALMVGVLHWMWGGAAGKVFLNWRGVSLSALVSALLVIWYVAAASARRRRTTPGHGLRVATLVLLALAAAGFVRACDPGFLPPVNPTSGGATGHNLLASTLGFAALVAVIPQAIFPEVPKGGFRAVLLYAALMIGVVIHAALGHGDVSNRVPAQVYGLAYTIILGGALAYRMAQYPWRSRTPLAWFAFWWLFTAVDGVLIFLPGILEYAKFTNALVAHAGRWPGWSPR